MSFIYLINAVSLTVPPYLGFPFESFDINRALPLFLSPTSQASLITLESNVNSTTGYILQFSTRN